jgi:hypothetical protein
MQNNKPDGNGTSIAYTNMHHNEKGVALIKLGVSILLEGVVEIDLRVKIWFHYWDRLVVSSNFGAMTSMESRL